MDYTEKTTRTDLANAVFSEKSIDFRSTFSSVFLSLKKQVKGHLLVVLKNLYPRACNLYYDLFSSDRTIYSIRPGLTEEECNDLYGLYIDFVKRLLKELNLQLFSDWKDIRQVDLLLKELLRHENDQRKLYSLRNNDLPDYIVPLVTKKFEWLVDKNLSTRAKNFLCNYRIPYSYLVNLFDKDISEYYILCPGSDLSQTLSEIHKFNETIFKPVYYDLKKLEKNEVLSVSLKMDFDFLDDKDVDFVSSFYKKNKYLPALFILKNRLKTTKEREYQMFADYYGISDGGTLNTTELAAKYKLTAERCRQIVSNCHSRLPSGIEFDDETLSHYAILDIYKCILPSDDIARRIMSGERLDMNYKLFAALCEYVCGLRVNLIGMHYPIFVLGQKSFFSNISFGKALKEMERISQMKQSKDLYLPIENLFPNISEDQKEDVFGLFAFVVKERYKLKTTDDYNVIFPTNTINPGNVIVDILRDNGKPMHINDIFAEFKKRCPGHKYKEPKRLRAWMQRVDEVRNLGMTSVYALTEWEGLFFGNIKMYIVKLLSENGKPMHINDIVPKVLEVFPKSNKLSIYNTMKFDEQGRFLVLDDSYYYLSESCLANLR